MGNLKQLVTQIKDEFVPDWSRSRILNHIDRAVRALYNRDSARSIFYTPADPQFPVPYLKTVAGQLTYDITDVNLVDSSGVAVPLVVNGTTVVPRRIKHVFIESRTLALQLYQPRFRGERYDFRGYNPYWKARLQDSEFYAIPGVAEDRSNETPAQFRFLDDPGNTTNFFHVEFYYSHPTIDSERAPVTFDLDIWEDAVIDGTVGHIEDRQNGASNRLERFQKEWIGKWCDDANVNMRQRSPVQFPFRECG